jgi:hypothetical protein
MNTTIPEEADFSDLTEEAVIKHRLVLTITYPDKVVEKEIYVTGDKKITFGSSEQVDIIIPDNSVAPVHFSFHYDDKPTQIEIYEPNTIFKEKENSFYAGLVKIKIEKYKEKDYIPINNNLFKVITEGFSPKKTFFFFIFLIFMYYLSTINDGTFISNEDNSRDTAFYSTLWIAPNLMLGVLSFMYIMFTYFSSNKNQRFFTKIIQQNVLKYSIKLSFIYFLVNSCLYVINGFMNIPSIYSAIMQTLIIFNFFLISKRIINLNHYAPAEKKKVTKIGYIYFFMLFLFTQTTSLSTAYITWIPIQSKYSIQNNQDLEVQADSIIKTIKSDSLKRAKD